MMSPDVLKAAQDHALQCFPRESCGLVVAGRYIACENTHETPEDNFKIASDVMRKHVGKIEMIVHSHPNGDFFPSEADMVGQVSTAVTWAIIVTDGTRASDPVIWGDSAPMAPLLGRPFVHGIADCYSTIRDTFRLGKDALKAADIAHSWPFDPIVLPEVPRADGWWNIEGSDLYESHFSKFGFIEIPNVEARAGDVFLTSILSEKLNHGGLLVEDDLLLHHLPGRLSRREPAGLWARSAKKWIRYVGTENV